MMQQEVNDCANAIKKRQHILPPSIFLAAFFMKTPRRCQPVMDDTRCETNIVTDEH